MAMPDEFSEHYSEFIENTYDCIDRIVLNAFNIFIQQPGGFRLWWRQLFGDDTNLDNTHLMRFAGRFARRIRAMTDKNQIPLIECKRGVRKQEISQQYLPADPSFCGVFCILYGRSSASVRDVQQSKNGSSIHISKKYTYVNQYFFHIMDPEWGHIIIKLCPHPPFNAQIILNGHEYVERKARKENITFTKEGNCFTEISDTAGLAGVADTMRTLSSGGRLVQVCERWIYSACLLFSLDLDEQESSGFHYSFSVFQIEYSRNLLFQRGRTMEEIFQSVIDRSRGPLNIDTLKTIFGYKHRPYKRDRKGKLPRFEAVVERPVYNLTVFKINLGKLTVKMYSKGERVLRIEVVAHNTKDLRCGVIIDKLPLIIESLKGILERFMSVIRCVDASFVDNQTLESRPLPSVVGSTRVGGVDVNLPRMRTVMNAVIALSTNPRGFTASELAAKVRDILEIAEADYTSRQASYDLKKLRGKGLIFRIKQSHYYKATSDGLKAMQAYLVIREKVLAPLLSSSNSNTISKNKNLNHVDIQYQKIQFEMLRLFDIIGIAA